MTTKVRPSKRLDDRQIDAPCILIHDDDSDDVLVLDVFPEWESSQDVEKTAQFQRVKRIWEKLGYQVTVSEVTPGVS